MTYKFKDKLDNTPHLMTENAFVNFVDFIQQNPTKEYLASLVEDESVYTPNNYDPTTKIGTLPVSGSLEYRTEWYHRYGYGTSYEMLLESAEEFAKAGAETFFMPVDSGGGEAYGMFETGQQLRSIADANNIKIICYVDGMSASAAYGLSAVADEVIANPQSEVGSIGVVVRLRNVNKAMQEMGVEDKYIFAGKSKIPYKADGSWRKDFIDDIQAKVDTLYEEFTNYVAGHREMSVDTVKSTEAATYLAKDALELGLIDRVMTHEEFSTYLADYVQNKQEKQMFNKTKLKLNSEQEKVEMKELEDAKLELSGLQEKFAMETEAKLALESKVTELSATLESLQTKLSSLEEISVKLEAEKEAVIKAQAVAEQAALEAKLVKRKEQLSAVLPEDKVEDAFTELSQVSDKVFEFTISGYQAAEEAVKQTALFKEAGGEGSAVDHGKPDPVKAHLEWQAKQYNKTK